MLSVENPCGKLSQAILFCVCPIPIGHFYVEISPHPHLDSFFIFCCIFQYNIFWNILIIYLYIAIFCLLQTILYVF